MKDVDSIPFTPYAPSMRHLLLLVILLNPACARPADTARVIGVSDGDTLTVLRGRTQTRIRLHGIDAPETGQDYGRRASRPPPNSPSARP